MQIHELRAPKGSRKKKRILGRGIGSGRGKTAGRGENGQGSRAGRGVLRSSEGGQMSLIRRLPKVGFRSKRPLIYQVVKLGSLDRFQKGTLVDAKALQESGLIRDAFKPFKVLANGEITKALTVQAYSFSKAAEEKIIKAGGKIEKVDQQILKEAQTSTK